MEHHVDVAHRGGQRGEIQRITAGEGELRPAGRVLQEPHLTGREIVERDDGMAVCEKAIDQCAADEASSAGDKCTH